MNDPIITDPTWQQIGAFGGYVEAFGAYFLIGLGLILVVQITLVVLQCRELARRSRIESDLVEMHGAIPEAEVAEWERGQPARILAGAGGTPALPS